MEVATVKRLKVKFTNELLSTLLKIKDGVKLIDTSGNVASPKALAIDSSTRLPYQYARIYNDNAILIDLTTSKVTFNVNYLLYLNTIVTPVAAADFDLTSLASWASTTIVCYYNKTDNKIYVKRLVDGFPAFDAYILFFYYGGGTNAANVISLITENPRSVHIKLLDGTMRQESSDTVTIPRYNETDHRLILPPKMFFVEDNPLPLYKSNFIAYNSTELAIMKTALINVDSNNNPRFLLV
jgi:hypothetical protein